MTGISIGKYIQQVLRGDSALTSIVGERIYPLVVPDGVDELPVVIYRRESIDNEPNKDGYGTERVTVTLTAIGNSYEDSVLAAEAISDALNNRSGMIDDLEIMDCKMEGANEEYDVQSTLFTQSLTLTFTTC